jgi:dimethylamine/trimethylamine dehydrogenase
VTPAGEASPWTRNTLEQHHIQTRLIEIGVGIATLPWCTTLDLGPQLSCTRGFKVSDEQFQTHAAQVCEQDLPCEELA